MSIRYFYFFRIFFHARFYYPVFAVLFLDLGLTIEQFAFLNALWAATIVLLEVPSGVLADLLGRATLLRISAGLMVTEMLLILLVPVGHPDLVFWMLLANRIVSGTSEAMSSGADEAWAYDTLVSQGHPDRWPHVLEHVMKWNAAAMVIAMIVGAVLYDPDWMSQVWGLHHLSHNAIIRLPVVATFCSSLVVCYAALRMREPPLHEQAVSPTGRMQIGTAVQFMLRAGWRVLTHPVMFLVILTGLMHDSIIRLLLTLSSEYFRWLGIPARYFGLLGATMAVMGLFMPALARRLVQHTTAPRNFILTATLTLLAFGGIALTKSRSSFLFVLLMMAGFNLLHYFVSYYLNREAASHERATILSFKGLAFNLGYGVLGLLYSAYSRYQTTTTTSPDPDTVFGATLHAFPVWFAASLALLAATALLLHKKRTA